MNDLQQLQIKQCLQLALPNGLPELMSDLSREVLRSQPVDLYNFITEYLGALLEARDKLSIAAQICDEVCHGSCQPELDDELRDIGLSDEEIKTVGNIVQMYFNKEKGKTVSEKTLLMKLTKKVKVDETVFEAIVEAVRAAFRRHFAENTLKYKLYCQGDDKDDSATAAAKNTVRFYRNEESKTSDSETEEPTQQNSASKKLGFADEARENMPSNRHYSSTSSVSSMSLAGSFVDLPKHTPYAATLPAVRETIEREQMQFHYKNYD